EKLAIPVGVAERDGRFSDCAEMVAGGSEWQACCDALRLGFCRGVGVGRFRAPGAWQLALELRKRGVEVTAAAVLGVELKRQSWDLQLERLEDLRRILRRWP
ncbi:unnamed protein product, partial [Effrenium voratum]